MGLGSERMVESCGENVGEHKTPRLGSNEKQKNEKRFELESVGMSSMAAAGIHGTHASNVFRDLKQDLEYLAALQS